MRTPQHDGRREPLLLDVLAECVQLIGRHEREQLGRGVDLQYVAPALGHAAPLRWRRTGGERFGRNSGTLRADSGSFVPLCSVFALSASAGDSPKTSISSAFPRALDLPQIWGTSSSA